ncbi:MAG: FadR/GntR family transcriptional regulator [Thermomicrobiales bacterium]
MTPSSARSYVFEDQAHGRRALLSERVAQQIERFIVDGGLQPGDRLPSGRDLTERYGVSRTAVRDAIAILEQRGLVETWPGSGVFVRDGGSDAVAGVLGQMLRRNAISFSELLETRQVLEVHNVEVAASRASPDQLSAMDDHIAGMRAAGEPMLFVEADVRFHEALGDAAGNRVLTAFLRSLRPLLLQGMLIGTGVSGAREAAIREHAAMLEAIRAGDALQARTIMERHLRRGYEEWLQAGYGDLAVPGNGVMGDG